MFSVRSDSSSRFRSTATLLNTVLSYIRISGRIFVRSITFIQKSVLTIYISGT